MNNKRSLIECIYLYTYRHDVFAPLNKKDRESAEAIKDYYIKTYGNGKSVAKKTGTVKKFSGGKAVKRLSSKESWKSFDRFKVRYNKWLEKYLYG